MSNAWQRTLNISIMVLLSFALFTAVILFTALFRYDRKMHTADELYSVMLEGEYSEEGGPWKPLTQETEFKNWKLRDITVRGHFNRDLPQGINLFLNLDHMRVSLQVNNEEIFRLEPVEGDGNPTKAMAGVSQCSLCIFHARYGNVFGSFCAQQSIRVAAPGFDSL